MRIGIQGYQSLTRAIVDINPGEIVVLRGANNSGKSAFLRGISSFITNNPTQEDYINVDIGFTRVIVKDDKVYEWNRTGTKVKYLVDGQEEVKLNRASIAEVIPESGFLYVRADSEKFLPQICEEGTVWFPYNYPASVAFKIFSKFMAPPKISVLIKDIRENIKKDKESLLNATGRIDVYETEYSRLDEELRKSPSLEEVDKVLQRVSKWIEGKQKYDSNKKRYENSIKAHNYCAQLLNEYEKKKEGYKKLQEEIDKYGEQKKEAAILLDSLIRANELEQDKNELKEKVGKLSSFVEENKKRIEKIGETKELIVKLSEAVEKRKYLIKEINRFEETLKVKNEEKNKYSVCPLCERPFDKCLENIKM